MALVLWAALDLHQEKRRDPGQTSFVIPFFRLLDSMMWWPDVRLLLLASEPGRSTVLRAYERILVRGDISATAPL